MAQNTKIQSPKPQNPEIDRLDDPKLGPSLTKAIIDTIQEPLVILDENLQIVAASKSFYKKFDLDFETSNNKMFYDLSDGDWNIPALRKLLEEVIPKHKIVENYEVDHKFIKSELGKRKMLLNAREIDYERGRKKMLISIFDVTEQRELERQNRNLSNQKDVLLKEMRHRIANSLQIIASILMLKAQSVRSKESRHQLQDAHDRIMSIATVQGHLDPEGLGRDVSVPTYLNDLCRSLATSMIGNRRPLSIKVHAGKAKVATDEAIGLGLMVTELVINSLKHAFNLKDEGEITITYEAKGSWWKLSVKDNGLGMSQGNTKNRKGLGAGIVDTLAKQLKATVKVDSSKDGTTVSITHKKQ